MKKFLRFKLRTLFLALLILGAGIAWLGNEVAEYQSEQLAIGSLLKCGIYNPDNFNAASIRRESNGRGQMVLSTAYM